MTLTSSRHVCGIETAGVVATIGRCAVAAHETISGVNALAEDAATNEVQR